MKKILLMAVATVAMSLSSFGATLTVSCGANVYGSTGTLLAGTATRTCPNFAVAAGDQLTNVTLNYFVDYSYSPSDSPAISVTVNFNPSGTNIFTNDTVNVTQTGLGTSKNPLSSPNSGSQTLVLNGPSTYAGASVLVTPGAISGPLESFTTSITATYTYNTIPVQGAVPEPTTVALIGAGLVGLASVARRRRS